MTEVLFEKKRVQRKYSIKLTGRNTM